MKQNAKQNLSERQIALIRVQANKSFSTSGVDFGKYKCLKANTSRLKSFLVFFFVLLFEYPNQLRCALIERRQPNQQRPLFFGTDPTKISVTNKRKQLHTYFFYFARACFKYQLRKQNSTTSVTHVIRCSHSFVVVKYQFVDSK